MPIGFELGKDTAMGPCIFAWAAYRVIFLPKIMCSSSGWLPLVATKASSVVMCHVALASISPKLSFFIPNIILKYTWQA